MRYIFHCWQKTARCCCIRCRKESQISVASLHDEDLTTVPTGPHTIEMSAQVKAYMDAGLTSLAGLNNGLESLYDEHIQDPPPLPPIVSGTNYYENFKNSDIIFNHCQSLPSLQSPVQLKSTSPLQSHLPMRSLRQYGEVHENQDTLDNWLPLS